MVGIDAWEMVRSALGNPDWDFRSIEGIARKPNQIP